MGLHGQVGLRAVDARQGRLPLLPGQATVGAHVDDLLCVGEPGVGDKVLERLRAQFDFGEWKDVREEPTLIYGGKEISKKGDVIALSQEAFIRALTLTPVPKWRTIMKDKALNAQESTELKSGGGCLRWLVGQTRPNLAAGTSLNMGGNPTILAINNLLGEALKSKDWALQFRPLDLTKARVICFSDASRANTESSPWPAMWRTWWNGGHIKNPSQVQINACCGDHGIGRCHRCSAVHEGAAGRDAHRELPAD